MRLGIIGCGRIAERGYLPAARATPGVELVALADPDQRRLRECVERCRAAGGAAAGFGSAAEMLEAAAPDAVVVATPPALHSEVAATAAAAGVPALVEKPPAADLEEAVRLAALEPAPAIGFNRRFLQGEELAGAVPAAGWLELELELRFRRRAWDPHQVRDDVLIDAGIHLADLACFLSGSVPLCARRAVVGPDRASFELELGRGRARISCAADARYAERVRILDRAGRATARSRIGGVSARFAALGGRPQPLELSLRRELAAFAAHLGGGERGALASAADGVRAMAAIEAARRSAELGGAEVTVAPVATR